VEETLCTAYKTPWTERKISGSIVFTNVGKIKKALRHVKNVTRIEKRKNVKKTLLHLWFSQASRRGNGFIAGRSARWCFIGPVWQCSVTDTAVDCQLVSIDAAVDCLERLVSEMICYVPSEMLNSSSSYGITDAALVYSSSNADTRSASHQRSSSLTVDRPSRQVTAQSTPPSTLSHNCVAQHLIVTQDDLHAAETRLHDAEMYV